MSSTKISKFLSLVLRHKPEAAGVKLDENGWVDIDLLIAGAENAGKLFDRGQLERVVRESDKQRFIIDGDKIRANQGHSVKIDLELIAVAPPDELFHGTVDRFMDKIMSEGLKKMKRHHVHLSPDIETAEKVGSRRGVPVLLRIDSLAMYENGHQFMCSENGVWLTETVPSSYISKVSRDA